MNILIYGQADEQNKLESMIANCGPMQYRKITFSKPECYDHYLNEIRRVTPQLIFVCEYGADGMEAVIAAKNLHPDASVIWFSDDVGFLSQSYRLGCSFFSADPITHELLMTALNKSRVTDRTGGGYPIS